MNANTKHRLGRHRRSVITETYVTDAKPQAQRAHRVTGPVPTLGRHVRSWAERAARGRKPWGINEPGLSEMVRVLLHERAMIRRVREEEAHEAMDDAEYAARRKELTPALVNRVAIAMSRAGYSLKDIERFAGLLPGLGEGVEAGNG